MDTSPARRRESPDMYGMVPDSGRAVTFAFMFSICFVQLINKGIAMALLYVTESSWMWWFIAGDMAIYFIQKLFRRDFTALFPVPGVLAIPVSVIYRSVVKVVSDFSGSLHFRNPYELGGVYFSINLVMAQCSVFGAVYLYVENFEGDNKIKADKLWKCVSASVLLWIVMFRHFIFNIINPEYRKTFWSKRTGWQQSCSYFLDHEDDGSRILVFADNPILWKSVAPRVKEWTLANWGAWVDTKPDWFTPKVVSTVPDEFIPPRFLSGLGGQKRERRASAKMSRGGASARAEVVGSPA
jgi:hypothetical protein